jgi:hypothetical protein
MPKIDIPAVIAIAIAEPVGSVFEQERAGREWVTSKGELLRHPTEKAAAIVIETLKDIRRKTGKFADNLSPAGAVYLLTGLTTEADSRKAAARRAWSLLSAPLEGGGVCATAGAETFGVAFARLLTDENLLRQAREFWIASAQGVAAIEFNDGSISRFKAVGPGFAPDKAIVTTRSLEVAKLAPVVAALAASAKQSD